MEHRDRVAGFGVEEHLEAALAAQGRGRREGETAGDLAGDMMEVLTGVCARLDGRCGARHRAVRVVTAAARDPAAGVA